MASKSLTVLAAFQRLKGKMCRLTDPLVQAEGLTPLQGYVLLLLAQREMTVGELSEETRMGQANASTLCKKLEQGGYRAREKSRREERVGTLSLTDEGRETLERIEARFVRYAGLLDGLPQSVKDDIRAGVRAMDEAMDYLQDQIEGETFQC